MMAKNSSAALIGSSLTSFYSGMSEQERQDIKDCLLYAELYASEKFDRQQLWTSWMNRYQRGLLKLGFTLTGFIVENPIQIESARDFDRVTFDAMSKVGSAHLAELAHTSFSAMKSSEHAKVFLDSWFSTGRSESFQVVPCENLPSGELQVLVCGLNMTSRTVVEGPFFWNNINSEMTVRINGGSFAFNSTTYAEHRARVRTELGDQAKRYITEIEL
ncbi:MAG: hypothetical protein ACOH2O_09650 [Pseudomonas sp.]